MKVELKFIPTDKHGPLLAITINGRQSLAEGPRIIGHCAYCAGRCLGATADCETRVFHEARTGAR